MLSNEVKIGCGQITWQGDAAKQAMADIAQAGYAGAPANPQPGRTNQDVLAEFERHGLQPAPGYLGADFWNPDLEQDIVQRAIDYTTFAVQAGCSELYVAAGGFQSYITSRGLTRAQVAGHVTDEDEMKDTEYAQFAKVLSRVGEITLAQGVRCCFHNHAGSVIETRQEIDRLYSMVDPEVIFMGPDTGHLVWGGADVEQFFRDYTEVILTAHIKDIDPNVLKRGVAEEWDYATFSDKGVFTELGQGMVDFTSLFMILENAGFGGWLIVETDVTQQATALESARISRNYLKQLGL